MTGENSWKLESLDLLPALLEAVPTKSWDKITTQDVRVPDFKGLPFKAEAYVRCVVCYVYIIHVAYES